MGSEFLSPEAIAAVKQIVLWSFAVLILTRFLPLIIKYVRAFF